MSLFSAIDLAALPNLTVLQSLDYEQELFRLKTRLRDRAAAKDLDLTEELNLETEPLVILLELLASEVVRLNAQINDQARGLSLATTSKTDLDHVGLTYHLTRRLTLEEADPTANPPKPAVMESDEDYLARLLLASELKTTAGSMASYIYHILKLDGVADISDVWPFSEVDNATYSAGMHSDAHSMGLRSAPFTGRADGDPVLAPEVLAVILPKKDYGPADQALLDRAWSAASRKEVRPIGDLVRIEPAQPIAYNIEAKLLVAPGADAAPLIERARAAALAYVDTRRRIGVRVQQFGIAAALKVHGVLEVELTAPAADIVPGSKSFGELVGEPVITSGFVAEGWRP